MRKPHFHIRPEGLNIISLTLLATLVFALLGWATFSIIGLVAFFFALNFFRDPERVVPDAQGVAVAPADGRVVKVEAMQDPFTKEQRTAVCIFMNVFNVHVNRFPLTGRVRAVSYHPGKFVNASLDKASLDNERCALHFDDEDNGTWTMVQIAGLLARRIVCYAETGDSFSRGQRFGLIKLGSRVDLYLPHGYESTVNVGDKTIAGQSIIARKNDSATGST
ncbi:phosphatidylserine decarboxylase family protein [Desulfonatronospira sp.]|uniref:phosphatidylserine decarboxylase family protein n=1 Tax=Desulfonatronospira sp. TaxID=1962951 RepID=UPI0025BFAC1F|nr:phosphatidylserine decarboxylase family protein [Desulfonatronospira sp.]